jgi:AraC-like DNA-binding protein
MFLVASAGIIRLLYFPPTKGISYIGHFTMTGLSLIFTSLNFISFLYLIETSRLKRKVLKKISIACTLIFAAIGSLGLIFPETQFYMKLMMSSIYVFACIVLFTGSIREYDKFILQMDNFYDDELKIKWIPSMLWATFGLALIMTGAFYYKHISLITGIGSLLVYTTVCMKLLSFIPDNIHVVRRNIKENKIIAQDHGEHLHIFPLDGPAEPVAKAENTIISDKDAKRNEKIASLMEKWVNMEGYIKPDINIKDVASEMGTNSNYLSTYINKVLDTSFATWLNTLRIEKSKEFLCGSIRISVEECGMKSGYTNLYNYSRWFKTITGMSPSEWRKTQCGTKIS